MKETLYGVTMVYVTVECPKCAKGQMLQSGQPIDFVGGRSIRHTCNNELCRYSENLYSVYPHIKQVVDDKPLDPQPDFTPKPISKK